MVAIRTVFHITGRWGVIIVLCSLASNAWAADKKDWLDEMPTVPAVVQAVRGDLCKAQFDGDEDLLAANIAGTLMQLTWIMYFQVLEDGGASPPRHPTAQWVMDNLVAGLKKMSESRLAKLKSIQESYMQAELVIGRGTGKRRGILTTIHKCNTDDSFSMRVGNKTLGCYPYKFHNLLGNIYPSMNHRRQILPKLFPKDQAQHYVDLVTRYVMAAPSLDEPATTLSMPDSGYAMPGPDYCTTNEYGGDYDCNGLCDDWEKPPCRMAIAVSSAAATTPRCTVDNTNDSDGDGLPDEWETAGIMLVNGKCVPRELAFDFNGNGRLDPEETPALKQKDIYVELDYMEGCKGKDSKGKDIKDCRLEVEAIELVRFVFAHSPLRIRLHVFQDQQIPSAGTKCVQFRSFCRYRETRLERPDFDSDENYKATGDFDDIKKRHFGGKSLHTCAITETDIKNARGKIFRYALAVDHLVGVESKGESLGVARWSGGEEEPLAGYDFMVPVGKIDKVIAEGRKKPPTFNGCEWGERDPRNPHWPIERWRYQAAIFMHELGHTLGLHHGGKGHDGLKPNYVSVMNYSYAAVMSYQPGALKCDGMGGKTPLRIPLDYSQEALSDLDEGRLDEGKGIRVKAPEEKKGAFPSTQWIMFSYGENEDVSPPWAIVPADDPKGIDWDQSGTMGVAKGVDINKTDTIKAKTYCGVKEVSWPQSPYAPDTPPYATNNKCEEGYPKVFRYLPSFGPKQRVCATVLEGHDDWEAVRINLKSGMKEEYCYSE